MIKHERLNRLLTNIGIGCKGFGDRLQSYFIAGVLVFVPAIATIGLVYFLFKYVDDFLGQLFGVTFPGAGLILTALICLVFGIVAQNVVGKKILDWIGKSLEKVPVISSVYTGIKQVADVFMKDQKSAFKRVVMLEYPKEDCWVIGFVTADFTMKVDGDIKEKDSMVTVFVPTTPNPTSGFLLILPKSKIIDMNIDIDVAMKVIISGGIVQKADNNAEVVAVEPALVENNVVTEKVE